MRKIAREIQFYIGFVIVILSIVFSIMGMSNYILRIVIFIVGLLLIITSKHRIFG